MRVCRDERTSVSSSKSGACSPNDCARLSRSWPHRILRPNVDSFAYRGTIEWMTSFPKGSAGAIACNRESNCSAGNRIDLAARAYSRARHQLRRIWLRPPLWTFEQYSPRPSPWDLESGRTDCRNTSSYPIVTRATSLQICAGHDRERSSPNYPNLL